MNPQDDANPLTWGFFFAELERLGVSCFERYDHVTKHALYDLVHEDWRYPTDRGYYFCISNCCDIDDPVAPSVMESICRNIGIDPKDIGADYQDGAP